MDEFAQTRGADDLFDDEIIPASAEEQAQQEEAPPPQSEVEAQKAADRHDGDSQPAPDHALEPSHETHLRSKRGGRPVWRGKRRTDRATNKPTETSGGQEKEAVDDSADTLEDQTTQDDDTKSSSKQPAEANQHVPAVRGDRSATGGIRKVWPFFYSNIGLN